MSYSSAYYTFPTNTFSVKFAPVSVSKGRKYKGKGFIVATLESYGSCGWRHTGYGWEHNTYDVQNARIWVPELKAYRYANCKYVEDDTTIPEEECQKQLEEYVNHIIRTTIEWCRSKEPFKSDAEINRFARNVLRKNHSELMEIVDKVLPDNRDLESEIANTIAWAISLNASKRKTEKRKRIAKRALTKKGLANRPEFNDKFEFIWQNIKV